MADYTDTVTSIWPFLQTQESGNNPNAISPVGAFGLAQLMPATARNPGFGITPWNPQVPGDDVRVGQQYLGAMLNRYNGSIPQALAAYNAGPGRVPTSGFNLAALPGETRQYVGNIMGKMFGATPANAAPMALASSTPPSAPGTGIQQMGILPDNNSAPAPDAAPDRWGPGNPLWMTLMSLGSGIASESGHGWGPGIGAGIQSALQNAMMQRMYGLKLAELGLEARKTNALTTNKAMTAFNPAVGGNTPVVVNTEQGTMRFLNPDGSPAATSLPQAAPQAPAPQPSAPTSSAPDQSTAPTAQADVPTPVSATSLMPPAASMQQPQFNEAALAKYPQWVQLQARGMATGDLPLPVSPRGGSMGGASTAQAKNLVLQAATEYNNGVVPDATMFSRKQATLASATSGKLGDKITAGNTLVSHLLDLVQNIQDLHNGPYPIANSAKTGYATTIGGPGTLDRQDKIATLRENLNAALGEAAKLWAAGQGSEGELKNWEGAFNENQPMQTQLKAVGRLAKLAEGKVGALNDQIASGMPKGTTSVAPKALTPTAQQSLDFLKGLEQPKPNAKQLEMLRGMQKQPGFLKEWESRFGPAQQYLGGA